jgi:hypothetical protein
MRTLRSSTPVLASAAVVLALAVAAPIGAAEAAPSSAERPAHASAAKADGVHGFTALPPTRILDTRTSPITHRLGPASTTNVVLAGVGGVPASGVSAVVLNITGIARTHSSYLSVFPAGDLRPLASTLNLYVNEPRANQVFAWLGKSGAVSIYNSSGDTDLLVDVSGYFSTTSSYTGQRPIRVLNTHHGGEVFGGLRNFPIAGRGNIPLTGASAVVLNSTGIPFEHIGGNFTVFPGHEFIGATTSNLNVGHVETAAALVVAPLNDTGAVGLYGTGEWDLLLDVQGWFTGTTDYHPITPTRIFDTRRTGRLGYRVDTPLLVGGLAGLAVPSTAGAVVVSVTVVKPTAGGYLTVHPGGTAVPATSNINVQAGATTANMVTAQLATDGTIKLYDAAKDSDVVVDVMGWLDTDQLGP